MDQVKCFAPDEIPTRPRGKEYVAARVVELWNLSSPKDQQMVMRMLELTARANQVEVEWS